MSHLTERAWSVVTMNDVMKTDMIYDDARKLCLQLAIDKTLTGLCVVSNQTAQNQLENTAKRNREKDK